MSSIRKVFIFGIMALTLFSCIDPLNVDTQESRQILVVEGSITTLPGPHRILLSKSDKYGSVLDGFVKKETNATVWIREENGEQVFLTEESKGSYFTPADFKAEVGEKYSLFVVLASGERYVSTPEEVQPVPPVDSLIVHFKKQPSLDQISLNTGLEIYARWKDPAEVDNFYMWEAEGIYILNTRPDLFVGRDGQGTPVPAPKSCCDRCYVYEFDLNTELRLFKDNLSDGVEQTELAVYIPDDGKRFMEKYMVIVKQSSLTKEAYQFFDLLKNQLSIHGNIFDPPPATIRGNMINLGQPDEDVIGFFRASDVKTDTLYLLRNDVEEPRAIKQLNDDCRVYDNSTTERPPFWQ